MEYNKINLQICTVIERRPSLFFSEKSKAAEIKMGGLSLDSEDCFQERNEKKKKTIVKSKKLNHWMKRNST